MQAFIEWPLSQLFVVAGIDLLFVGYIIHSKRWLREKIITDRDFNFLQFLVVIVVIGCVIIIINMAVLANLYIDIRSGLELALME